MAITLGFMVIMAAGMAVAYFVGAQAAKSRTPPLPAQPLSTNNRKVDSDNAPTAPEVASSANCVTAVATNPQPSATEKPWEDFKEKDEQDPSSDTRRFKRSAFSGTALATIYPPKSRASDEPMRCEVLTRDLSRTGIGIAHTERLVPQQMVVLEAVGKLLVSEVRWCKRVDKGLYVVGCRLIKVT